MENEQIKSLISLCGGNNSLAHNLNVKVDPQSRALRIDTIKPGDITQYLKNPSLSSPQPGVGRRVENKGVPPTPAEHKLPDSTPEHHATTPVVSPDIQKNDLEDVSERLVPGTYNGDVLIRIAVALERIANVAELYFRNTETVQEEVQTSKTDSSNL